MSSTHPEAALREHLIVGFPDLGRTDLDRATPVGEAALVVVRPAVARFLVLEPAVRQSDDAEAVHDMRVAARRIRTGLRLFRRFLPETSEGLDAELRWIASALGAVRDIDVQRAWLASSADMADPEQRPVRDAIDERFVATREEAQELVVEALDAKRFERLRFELISFARGPGLSTAEAKRPITEIAPKLVRRRYRAMRRAGRDLGPESSSVELHKLRIRAKRARYAIEFVAPLYGKPAESLAKRLVRLQDLLGELHDDELASLRLREIADDPEAALSVNAIFVLGGLAEGTSRRARKLRRRFAGTFAGTRGRRWKELKAAMAAGAG